MIPHFNIFVYARRHKTQELLNDMAERAVAVEEIVVRRGRVSVALRGKITRTTPLVESDLVLTETKLVYEVGQAGKRQEKREILLEDLIGVHVIQKPPANNSLACLVEIHSYPLSKKSRRFAIAEVQFYSAPTFRDNLYMAVDWKKAINWQCHLAVRKEFCSADENSTATGLCPNYHIPATSSICLELKK